MGGSYNCNYFYYKYFLGYKSERDDISNACTGNRILTSLKIMEVIITRKKLSELAEGFTVYPQVLTNARVTDKKAAQDDVDVQAAVKKVTEELGDIGRILVRESETESVVHVMVETESDGFEL